MAIIRDILNNTMVGDTFLDVQMLKERGAESGVVIWGTAKAGRYVLEICQQEGVKVICFVDSFDHTEDERIEGHAVYKADTFFQNVDSKKYLVVIACVAVYGIAERLESDGINYLEPDTAFLSGQTRGVDFLETLQNNENEIQIVYESLADEQSRIVYQSVLRYRLSFDRQLIKEVYEPNQYFGNDVIPNFHGRGFVDCGAYDGDTLNSLQHMFGNAYETYVALEPMEAVYQALLRRIKSAKYPNVRPLQIGAWHDKGIQRFESGAEYSYSSTISDLGTQWIATDTIDNICKYIAVDFIKMDIEGAEIPALYGARDVIRRDKPILAICIYHNASDLWKIPSLIKSFNPEYQLFIRHHSTMLCETVCYALPKGTALID